MELLTNPIWRRFWYPVAFGEDVTDVPLARKLLGTSIVLWRDKAGAIAAAEDRCPHRDGRLSQGWTSDGNIVCPYHGWQFGPEGTVACVPQTPAVRSFPSSFKVVAAYAAEAHGVAWVALDEPVRAIPAVPDETEPGWRFIRQFDEEWAAAPARLMENSFDPAHTVFVHRATFGDQSKPDVDVPSLERTDDGMVIRNDVQVVNPDFARAVSGEQSERTVRSSETEFFAPFLRVLTSRYPSGAVHRIVTAATPVAEDRLRLVQWAVRNDSEDVAPAADVVAFDRRVTLEDKWVLEGIERPYSYELESNVHIKVDRPTVEMRRIYKEIAEGTWSGLVPVEAPSALTAIR
jgi:phenylpropionate dioxygenase-like ring-hydroxylating dioxygenase large terminal subunit